MKYLEKNSTYKDKKKNVGARVSEVVLSALNNAESDSNDLGYTFSITRIIEKALQDTLDELVEKTGMDYLSLEQFKFEMNERQNIRNISSKDSTWVDFDKKANEIKLMALSDTSVDINLLLKKEEIKMTDYWDKYVINRKEKKVRSELEKLTESNQRLHNELTNMQHRDHEEYQKSIAFESEVAWNEGWGKEFDEAVEGGDKAYKAAFDVVMKKNEKAIQKIVNEHELLRKSPLNDALRRLNE